MNPIFAHAAVTIAAIAGLVAVQITGHNDQTITLLFGAIIGGGGWGIIQRQKDPVEKQP